MAPHAGGRPRLPLDETEVIRAYKAGESLPSIARRLGVDRSRITRAVEDAGIRRRDDRGSHWATKRQDGAA